MKSYLNVVRKIDVKKSEEANKLLTLYYDAIEKDRQGKPTKTPAENL